MEHIRTINDGDEFAKTTRVDVERQIVDVTRTTKHNGAHVACEWALDFAGCTPEQVLELATRSVVIMQQIGVRAAKVLTVADVSGTVDVADLLKPTTRTKKAPDVIIADNVKKLTQEQRERDHVARLTISRELWHEREAIVSVYLGR